VGGRARFFAEPDGAGKINRVLRWADAAELEWVALGGGTNVIFSDGGYRGLVLSTRRLRKVEVIGTQLVAGAGEPLSEIAWHACRLGLSGLEWACGIPGTIGGAVVMNAGTRAGQAADVVSHVDGVTATGAKRWEPRRLEFGYRTSSLLTGSVKAVVSEATFDLVRAPVTRTVEAARRVLDERSRRLPSGATAGCTFRNPPDGPTAGELLDRAGCKGMRAGDAYVSEIHANFIINEGSGNAHDVLELIEAMKRRVKDAFDIDLEQEIILYP
jgi:UDP-N-acetylmuramate dehydrogenase